MDCQALVVLLIFPSFSCSRSSLCVRACVCVCVLSCRSLPSLLIC